MYKCEYFAIHELVPPHIYKQWGERAWQFLDVRALRTLDYLRRKYGKITVNNYIWGGEREWSGLRTPDSPYYSETSQHTYGRAFDCLFHTAHIDKVRQDILSKPDEFPHINCIEMNVSWLHFDVRNSERIKMVYPA